LPFLDHKEEDIKEIIVITVYWIHLIATTIWIGGITFILFIALPSSKDVLGAESGKLIGEISKRFTSLANYCIITLVVTGFTLAWLGKPPSEIGFLENDWMMILILKLILVFTMVSIHFYRSLVLTPTIMRTETDPEKASLQKVSLNLVKVNFALGLSILLLSGAMSVLRGY
jgi:uncharacterized membrane protein